MKDKIFQALKQAFPQLGLGDEILMARAEALDATGLVTEENLQAVVTSQKANLEALQKSNDKRVAEALAKAKKDSDAAAAKLKAEHEAALKAEKDNLEAIKKELDELKAKNPGGQGGGQETNAQIEALKAAYDSKLEEINKTIKKEHNKEQFNQVQFGNKRQSLSLRRNNYFLFLSNKCQVTKHKHLNVLHHWMKF